MQTFLQDVRVGIRGLRRTPGFTLTAVLTLAVGIGLGTAVFTVADAFLLRPLPVRDQDRVVTLWGATRDGSVDNFPLLLPDARDFAARTRSLARVEFFGYGGAHLVPIRDGGSVFRLRRSLVSGGYFELLGTRPALGRALRPEDDVAGAAPVVVLSHGGWQRYFGGDPRVLGRQLLLHDTGVAHTIVGVMPRGLDYPQGTDFWAPVIPNSRPLGEHPVYAELNILGRLRPGATAAEARAELTAYFQRPEAPAWHRSVHGVVHGLTSAVLGDVRPALLAFAAAAALLLAITCINVANLLLVRGLARVREIAARTALGAGRGRIVGQLVTESAILAAGGGALGTLLAAAAVGAFVAFAPPGTPRLDEVRVNATIVGGAVAITALVTLLASLAPAVVTSRVELQDALRSGTRQGGASRRFRLGTEALVVGQVALALLVLSAAGLVGRSLVKLERVDLAFDARRLLVAELALPYQGFGDTRQQLALLDRLVPRLEAVPGVRAVAPALTAPFVSAGGIFGRVVAEGQSADEAARNPTLIFEVVTPSYFAVLGVPVRQGRAFSARDREGASPVAIISESAARHYWPGGEALGKRLKWGGSWATVVGVVPDTRYRDLRDPRPSIYFPLAQSTFPVAPTTLVVRADGRPADLVPAIRRAVGTVEPGVALASAASVETLLEGPLAQSRLNALLLSVFAAAALALAAVGLFGVMATMVRQRTRELGVRMALGATGRELRGLVMRRGLAIAAAGAAVGLLGALLANRLLAAMLYGVSPTDVATLAGVTALLLAVAVLASLAPARASTRVDPVRALRAEG
jgi:putative ABC transport system permease protein